MEESQSTKKRHESKKGSSLVQQKEKKLIRLLWIDVFTTFKMTVSRNFQEKTGKEDL